MSSSIPSWQILTAHAQPFRGARDLAFCLKVPLDSLLVWASSEGSGETARMRRLAWTFAARIGDKYQIRLTRSKYATRYKQYPWLTCHAFNYVKIQNLAQFWIPRVDNSDNASELSLSTQNYSQTIVNAIGSRTNFKIRLTSKWAASWQNQQNGMCAQRKLRSAWASAQSDQSLRCALIE